MGASHYLANKFLDLVYGGTAWTPPATVYGAQLLQDPQRNASAVLEPAVGGYARIAVTNNVTNFPAAANGVKSLNVEHAGTAATAAQGTVTHFGWFDDDGTPSGNLLSYVPLPAPEVMDVADVFTLYVGNYVLTLRAVAGSVLSYDLANKLANHYLGASVYSSLATLYAFASMTEPARDGTNITEPSGLGYVRKAVTNNAAQFGAAASGQKDNDLSIDFAAATGSWGTPLWYGFMSAASGGTLLTAAAILEPREINTGSIFKIPAGKMIAGFA